MCKTTISPAQCSQTPVAADVSPRQPLHCAPTHVGGYGHWQRAGRCLLLGLALASAMTVLAADEPEGATLKGRVVDTEGRPAAGLPVMLVGDFSQRATPKKTDAQGRFELEWNPQQMGRGDLTPCVLIRDVERNLAVAHDVEDGDEALELQLAPAMTLAGRAECDGQPVTNATATLVFWAGDRGMHLLGLAAGTNTLGRFEIPALPPGRRYGVVVSASGYGQQSLHEPGTITEAVRHEFRPVELKPAKLKLAGQVLDADDQPVAEATVNLQGEGQPSGNTRTDREGRFQFERVCEGSARLFAHARNAFGNLTAQGGDTNVILKLGESAGVYSEAKPHQVKGMVTDPDGKPVAGAQLTVFPSGRTAAIKSAADGSFNLTWSLEPWQLQQGGNALLVVRDRAGNQATAEDLEEEATNLNIRLKPALTLVGRVEDPEGKPLAGAEVGVWLLAARTYSQVDEQLAATDVGGRFTIKTLPPGLQYNVFAKAKDRGRNQQQVDTDPDAKQVEVEPFALQLADQVLAGQVLDAKDRPVSGISVSLSGEGQPEGNVTTDKQGRFTFKVCEGNAQLFASDQSGGYANTSAESGDTNVVLQLVRGGSVVSEAPRRATLKGKPLPDLTPLGFAAGAAPAGKPVLVCVLDVEQRPSRRVARLLAEQHDALKQKGVTVLTVQATGMTADALKEWQSANPVPFPIGRVADKPEKANWAAAIESLPWLILTDKAGRVVAEGFEFEELAGQLEGVVK